MAHICPGCVEDAGGDRLARVAQAQAKAKSPAEKLAEIKEEIEALAKHHDHMAEQFMAGSSSRTAHVEMAEELRVLIK